MNPHKPRIDFITKIITAGRGKATVRYDGVGPQVGIPVKDDVIVWGNLPDIPEGESPETLDRSFAEGLLKRAQAEAKKI